MNIHELNTKAITDPAYVALDDGNDTYKLDLNAKLSTMQSSISGAESDIVTAQGDITLLQTNMSQAQGAISSAQGEITDLQSDLNALSTQTAASIGNLQTELDATEDDVTDLKEAFNNTAECFSETIYNSGVLSISELYLDFAPGGLNGIDFLPSQTYRCTNKNIHETSESITLYVKDGFRVGWSTCDLSGTFVSWSTWFAGVATIPANTRFRIEIARQTEITSEIADVVEFTSAITLQKSAFINLKKAADFNSLEFDIAKEKTYWDKKTWSTNPVGYVPVDNTLAFIADLPLNDDTEIIVNNPLGYLVNIATTNAAKTAITTPGAWNSRTNQSYTFFASDKVLLAMVRLPNSGTITTLSILDNISIKIKYNNGNIRDYVAQRIKPIETTKYAVPWHIGVLNSATLSNHITDLNNAYSIISDDIVFDAPTVVHLNDYTDKRFAIYPVDESTGYYIGGWSGWLEMDYYCVAGRKYRINVALKDTSVKLTKTYGELLDSLILTPHKDVIPQGHWKGVCHRGFTQSGEIENTIPSLIEAKKAGYKYCECDIRITSDGYPVLAHNETLTGTVNGQTVTYTIANTTLATLQQLVLKESIQYGTVHPPTWAEYIECASLLGMYLVVDLYGSSQVQSNIENIVTLALKYGMNGKVLYTPSSTTVAGYILALDKRAKIRFYATNDYTAIKALMNGENEIIAIVTLGGDYANAESIIAARQAGLTIYIWNIDPNNYNTAFSLYPDYWENSSDYQVYDYSTKYIAEQGF